MYYIIFIVIILIIIILELSGFIKLKKKELIYKDIIDDTNFNKYLFKKQSSDVILNNFIGKFITKSQNSFYKTKDNILNYIDINKLYIFNIPVDIEIIHILDDIEYFIE